MRNYKKLFLLVLIVNLNYLCANNLDSLIIKHFSLNRVTNDKKEGMWIETDTNSVHLYSFGFYNQNIKQGEWFSINKKFDITKRFFIDYGDTLFYIDYVNRRNEYIDRSTLKKVILDNLNPSGISQWSSYSSNEIGLSEALQGYHTVNSTSGLRFSIYKEQLENIFNVNNERKIEGKMLLFENGKLIQIINFENGLVHGEVIYYKNDIEVSKLLYFHGVLIFPKKIKKKSLVSGYYDKGIFYPYSNSPIFFTHLLNGSFGITTNYSKNIQTHFPESKKIDNISKCKTCGIKDEDWILNKFIEKYTGYGW